MISTTRLRFTENVMSCFKYAFFNSSTDNQLLAEVPLKYLPECHESLQLELLVLHVGGIIPLHKL